MDRSIRYLKNIHPVLVLLFAAFFAYGILIPQLGFYWDDQPMSWIRYQLGPEAMREYFSTNRPVWGLLYQVTTRILPQIPIYWQVFAFLWRWLGAVAVWLIVKELWKDKPQFALSVSLFFLLYPGFNQQWGAYLYSHFFIVLFFYLISIYLMLCRKTFAALLFSALNLWMMEYFFVLEFARVGFIWISLRESYPTLKGRLKPTFRLWTPYLALFALAVLSRLFIFNNQIYGFSLMPQLRADPWATLLLLAQNLISSLWIVTAQAWNQIFSGIDTTRHGTRTIFVYAAVILVTVVFILFYLFKNMDDTKGKFKDALSAVGLGLFMLPFAGVPFWMTGLVVSLAHPASRFTLPFMLGVSFIMAGLIDLIPRLKIRYVVIALLLGLSAGRHFLWSVDYAQDWRVQKRLFWQMTWRAPDIQPDTMILMNEKLFLNADNSISAPLNWIYAPHNRSDRIDYVLFYPTNRIPGAIPELSPGIPIHYDYLAGAFDGNTSQTLAFYYDPPHCLRLLDPDIDAENHLIPVNSLMREASAISDADRITAERTAVMPAIYGPEPEHGWCYYFEKAELARQMGDWDEVARLGDAAFKLGEHPNGPMERFVYIEGYAYVGEWDQAIKYSREAYQISREFVGPLLCRLWNRIEAETEQSPERSEALAEVRSKFACNQ
ncbi:MAG TPA: hypothetical protein VK851_08325 [Anaerolineales bacterium]|nr:hypothetical protein [Anaerolineales bacterium]